MRRFVIVAAVLFVLGCLLQGCDVYHRQSTGNNVSVPVAPQNPAPQI